MSSINISENTLKLKTKIKILVKRIIHLNFITKFLGRVFLQRSYKTIRLFSNPSRLSATLWVDWHKEVFESWALKKNKDLYIEAANFYSKFVLERKEIIHGLPISGGGTKASRGGGANECLLYFLTRMINAKKALETGVSAGSSSRSILEALKINGESFILYSSDLATVLEKDQVGILVSESLRENWFLTHNGDNENLPVIFNKETNFDIMYYDSEKSYDAKKRFHDQIMKISLPKILIYDDIDRDSFFSECVKSFGYSYKIFGNAGIIFFDHKYF